MTTAMIKGQEVRVGDDLWSMGTPHRVTRITDYTHPVVTRGEPWRTAHSDGPGGARAWGRTLSFDHGYAAGYEITIVPGDERGVPHLPADDYVDPFYGHGAELHKLYAAEGTTATWPAWLRTRFAAVTHAHPGMTSTELRALARRQQAAGFPDWVQTAHKARLADEGIGIWLPEA